MTNTGIALCRVSTSQQRLEGNSLSAQELRIREVAQEKFDCEIVKTWSLDISSRKGKNYKRKDLKEMLRYCKENRKIRYLFVDEHDRYMRSVDEYYYWKGQFSYGAGVTLVIAAKPELALNPNSASLAMEFFGVWQGEVSNEERITKTTDKMQARIIAGYYPGVAKTCYQTTDTPGIHAPLEPQWSLMREAMHKLLYGNYTLHQALHWLNDSGFSMAKGGKLDMNRLKEKLVDPYYAGIVSFKSWDIQGQGLHKPMITMQEHKKIIEVVSGVKKKFTKQQQNPNFPMSNVIECSDCAGNNLKYPRYVGYRNHNGKSKKYYERYMCRECRRGLTKTDLHDQMKTILSKMKTPDEKKDQIKKAMKIVWDKNNAESSQISENIQTRIDELKQEKANLVRSIGSNPTLADDIAESVKQIKSEINALEDKLNDSTASNDNFEEFVEYSINYVDDLNANWWNLTPDVREKCKQLTFPGGIFVDSNKKVSTPEVSAIYRSNLKSINLDGEL